MNSKILFIGTKKDLTGLIYLSGLVNNNIILNYFVKIILFVLTKFPAFIL